MDDKNPHDALFKRVFSRTPEAAGLLRAIVPVEVARAVDWATLRPLPTEGRDPRLGKTESDLVFAARLGDTELRFVFLLEHQTTVPRRMAFRFWKYEAAVWDRRRGPPYPWILPIVVHQGPRRWTAPRDMADLLELPGALRDHALVPRLVYLVDDLTQLDVPSLRARALPATATVALWAMKLARDHGVLESVRQMSDLFVSLLRSEDGPEAYTTLLRYLRTVSTGETDLIEELAVRLDPLAMEKLMTLDEMYDEVVEKRVTRRITPRIEREVTERVEREITERVEREVTQRIEREVEARLRRLAHRAAVNQLVGVIERRLGAPSPSQRAALDAGDEAALARWTERALDAPSWDALLAE